MAVIKVKDGEPLGGGRIDTAAVFNSVIQEKTDIDFNSREYNEGKSMQNEGPDDYDRHGEGEPPIHGPDDIPF